MADSLATAESALGPARLRAIAPNTPATARSAAAPATASHGVTAFPASLRWRRSAPNPANTATTNATTKKAIPGARVFFTRGITAQKSR